MFHLGSEPTILLLHAAKGGGDGDRIGRAGRGCERAGVYKSASGMYRVRRIMLERAATPLHVSVHLLQHSQEPAQKHIEPAKAFDALAFDPGSRLYLALEPARQRLGQ